MTGLQLTQMQCTASLNLSPISVTDIDCVQANLRTKLTSSMQTNLSNMRRDNATQVYPPKYVLSVSVKLSSVVTIVLW